MGRRRLQIQRLECVKARQAKYSKRKIGILKKAKELAILCDIDLALLMFSPTGKPTLYVGQDKEEAVKIIKKMYPIDDSEALSNNSLIQREEAVKVKQAELLESKEKLAQKRKILRDWTNPDKINDLRQIKIMEEHLVATLARVKSKKHRVDTKALS
ncbi:PREDICTED: MADS-box transcription factor ANR1-like [Populus euphratica]|uniref:MADS-box transcription factor ANR1-like n=1 Tax=Populus euphratica TaxID=75702 RepID=A0AAJ6T1G4_POPEU|nr:PREDICTED: MADS-box transcription factor ANR1-like [Populus euphratica]